MKTLSRLLMVGLLTLLLGALVLPAAAQEVGPGEGAPAVLSFIQDPATFNPLLSNDEYSQAIAGILYPGLLALNPRTGLFEEGAAGGIAESWEISEDGLTYTFTLRDDWTWSDGTPITSADYLFGWNAINDPGSASPLTYVLDVIQSVEAPDPQTLVITLPQADCTAINQIPVVPILPAHVFEPLVGGDFSVIPDLEVNLNPAVTAGPFSFSSYQNGVQVVLLADQNYPDAELGFVVPEGYVRRIYTNTEATVAAFEAGELDYVGIPDERKAEFRERGAAGEFQVAEIPDNALNMVIVNMANPENPLDGLDADGNAVEQDPHPILGDVRVRQALAMAMDFEAINEGALFGNGIPLGSHSVPTSWADAGIAPYAFDPEGAAALLEEAGWVDADGDGVREASGAMYAEDGTRLSLEMIGGAGDGTTESLGVLLQDQWGQIGVEIDFQLIDFNVLVQTITGQTHDLAMLGWNFAYPDNPDSARVSFSPEQDVIGAGFNVSSYNNPEVNRLLTEARTVPGCDQAARTELYHQVQEILHDELPWIWINTTVRVSAAQNDVGNFEPLVSANSFIWNLDAWSIPRQ